MNQVVIGTSGHIDHGKTALVKALTGTDTDSLAQEKSRGMTIDLGFAFLNESITIIDVPGHEKFIRNMVAGVSTIHIALLVIAADDGIMPQTREHLQIISLLGIPKAVIALTKTDLVTEPEWLDLIEEEIHEILSAAHFQDAPIVRTSTNPESGIDELKNILIETTESIQQETDRGFFRMQIDRVFLKTGFGLVTTGTVISGELNLGDEVVSLPAGEKRKVRGIQSHGKSVDIVRTGDRAAVNLSGLSKESTSRGSELVRVGYLEPTNRIIANLTMIGDTAWKIKSKQRVHIHIGTSEVLGQITLPGNTLTAGEEGNCVLALEEPIIAAMDDRFVIRSYSPTETIAGGKVLDPNPSGTWKQIRSWTKDLSASPADRYIQFINKEWKSPKTIKDWSKLFHVLPADVENIVSTSTTNIGPMCVTEENLEKSKELFLNQVQDYHKKNPYRAFIGLKSLQDQLQFSSAWFETVSHMLLKEQQIKQIESGFALTAYKISISDKDKEKVNKVTSALTASKNMAVSEADLSGLIGSPVLKILHALKAQKKVIEIEQNLWMSSQRFQEMLLQINEWFNTHQELTVPDFKDILGLTRKTAIPILEYLDKHQFTERKENHRLKGENL